jgi:small subunit ribosomal protein S17
MADEQENETTETPEDAPEQAAGEQAPEAAADETPADAAADAPAAESDGGEPEATPEPAEPAEQLSSKERRRRARSTHTEVRPQRTPEERHAERVAERKRKAARRRARRQQERAKAAERRKSAPAADRSEIGQLAPVHAPREGSRRVRQGVVVSDRAEKTITVRIDVARRHRRYEKIVRSSSTLHAHDENNDAHVGDTVRVVESRPLSRTKRWALVDVLERAR